MRWLCLFVLFCTLYACGSSADSWERIEREGVLRVGLDPTYPPFENLVEGELVGLDVDLMRAVGAELGIDVHFDVIGYDGLYDALLTGRVDALASALIIDTTRSKEFAYTEPYFNAGQLLVIPINSNATGEVDLQGQTVAVELGAEGHVMATQWDGVEIVTLDSAETALNAVLDGTAAATITDAVSARLFVSQYASLKIAPDPLSVEPFAFVTRREDSELLRRLNQALETLAENGELDRISTDWLGDEND